MSIEKIANPWEEISLSDYENHMKLDSVMQLQNMNQMMKGQFNTYPVNSVMILGIAGGNGLEHIDRNKYIGYKRIAQIENPLPNGKKLIQLDFEQ